MLCLKRRFDAVLENRAPCCPEVLRPERHAGILEGESDVEETNGRANIEDEEDRICASSCKAGADSGQRGQDSPWALADPPSWVSAEATFSWLEIVSGLGPAQGLSIIPSQNETRPKAVGFYVYYV